jgi:hypothetical protein
VKEEWRGGSGGWGGCVIGGFEGGGVRVGGWRAGVVFMALGSLHNHH